VSKIKPLIKKISNLLNEIEGDKMQTRKDLKTLKDQVQWILHTEPATRNNDKLLWLYIVREFYRDKIFLFTAEYIKLDDILLLPSQDNVKRYRAYFQNDPHKPRYLPTSDKVKKVRQDRGKAQRDHRAELGYESCYHHSDQDE